MTRPDAWPDAVPSIDARGLECPEPVLRVRQALRDAAPGTVISVVATDPHAVLDFEAFCARGGHVLDRREERAGEYWFLIRRA